MFCVFLFLSGILTCNSPLFKTAYFLKTRTPFVKSIYNRTSIYSRTIFNKTKNKSRENILKNLKNRFCFKKLSSDTDPFELLGVDVRWRIEDVSKKYKYISLNCHPDRFSKINLSNEYKKILNDNMAIINSAINIVKKIIIESLKEDNENKNNRGKKRWDFRVEDFSRWEIFKYKVITYGGTIASFLFIYMCICYKRFRCLIVFIIEVYIVILLFLNGFQF